MTINKTKAANKPVTLAMINETGMFGTRPQLSKGTNVFHSP
jgi:hypothetical protein